MLIMLQNVMRIVSTLYSRSQQNYINYNTSSLIRNVHISLTSTHTIFFSKWAKISVKKNLMKI